MAVRRVVAAGKGKQKDLPGEQKQNKEAVNHTDTDVTDEFVVPPNVLRNIHSKCRTKWMAFHEKVEAQNQGQVTEFMNQLIALDEERQEKDHEVKILRNSIQAVEEENKKLQREALERERAPERVDDSTRAGWCAEEQEWQAERTRWEKERCRWEKDKRMRVEYLEKWEGAKMRRVEEKEQLKQEASYWEAEKAAQETAVHALEGEKEKLHEEIRVATESLRAQKAAAEALCREEARVQEEVRVSLQALAEHKDTTEALGREQLRLEEEIRACQQAAEAHKEAAETLRREAASIQEEVLASRQAADAQQEASEALRQEAASIQEEVRSAKEALESHVEAAEALRQEEARIQEEVCVSLQALREHKETVEALGREESRLEEEVRATQPAAEAHKEAAEALRQEAASIQEEIRAAQESAHAHKEALRLEAASIQEEISASLQALAEHKQSVEALREEEANIQEQIRAAVQAVTEHKEAAEALGQQNSKLGEEIHASQQAAEANKGAAEASRLEEASIQEQIRAAKESAEAHRDAAEALRQEEARVREEVSASLQALESHEEAAEALRREEASIQEEVSASLQALAEHKEAVEALGREESRLEEEIHASQQTVEAHREAVEALRQEEASIQEEVSVSLQLLREHKESVEALGREELKLEEDIRASQEAAQAHKGTVDTLLQEKSSIEEKIRVSLQTLEAQESRAQELRTHEDAVLEAKKEHATILEEINAAREEWEVAQQHWEEEYEHWNSCHKQEWVDHEQWQEDCKREREAWERKRIQREEDDRLDRLERMERLARDRVDWDRGGSRRDDGRRDDGEETKREELLQKWEEDKARVQGEVKRLEEQRARLTEEYREMKLRYDMDSAAFQTERAAMTRQRDSMMCQWERDMWIQQQELQRVREEIFRQGNERQVQSGAFPEKVWPDLIQCSPKRIKLTPRLGTPERPAVFRTPLQKSTRKRLSCGGETAFFTPSEGKTPIVERVRGSPVRIMRSLFPDNGQTAAETAQPVSSSLLNGTDAHVQQAASSSAMLNGTDAHVQQAVSSSNLLSGTDAPAQQPAVSSSNFFSGTDAPAPQPAVSSSNFFSGTDAPAPQPAVSSTLDAPGTAPSLLDFENGRNAVEPPEPSLLEFENEGCTREPSSPSLLDLSEDKQQDKQPPAPLLSGALIKSHENNSLHVSAQVADPSAQATPLPVLPVTGKTDVTALRESLNATMKEQSSALHGVHDGPTQSTGSNDEPKAAPRQSLSFQPLSRPSHSRASLLRLSDLPSRRESLLSLADPVPNANNADTNNASADFSTPFSGAAIPASEGRQPQLLRPQASMTSLLSLDGDAPKPRMPASGIGSPAPRPNVAPSTPQSSRPVRNLRNFKQHCASPFRPQPRRIINLPESPAPARFPAAARRGGGSPPFSRNGNSPAPASKSPKAATPGMQPPEDLTAPRTDRPKSPQPEDLTARTDRPKSPPPTAPFYSPSMNSSFVTPPFAETKARTPLGGLMNPTHGASSSRAVPRCPSSPIFKSPTPSKSPVRVSTHIFTSPLFKPAMCMDVEMGEHEREDGADGVDCGDERDAGASRTVSPSPLFSNFSPPGDPMHVASPQKAQSRGISKTPENGVKSRQGSFSRNAAFGSSTPRDILRQPRLSLTKQHEQQKFQERKSLRGDDKGKKWMVRKLRADFSVAKIRHLLVDQCGVSSHAIRNLNKSALIDRFMDYEDSSHTHSALMQRADISFKSQHSRGTAPKKQPQQHTHMLLQTPVKTRLQRRARGQVVPAGFIVGDPWMGT